MTSNFNFRGYTAEELNQYLEWEKNQAFPPDYPDCFVIAEYNKSLSRRERYDEGSILVSLSHEYKYHCLKSKYDALTVLHEAIDNEARFDGYYDQPKKEDFSSEDERFVYAWSCREAFLANRLHLS